MTIERVGFALAVLLATTDVTAAQQTRANPRARDLGVPFDGTPGPLNAITDVAGIEVGHATLISGEGDRAVRTGVTVVFPNGKKWAPVFAGTFAGNGFGDLTGTHWINEGGLLGGPIAVTNTYSVGTVRDAVVVASEPGTIFDDAALKAIARWRYNPRVESGEAVERVGLQTIIRFKLENSAASSR